MSFPPRRVSRRPWLRRLASAGLCASLGLAAPARAQQTSARTLADLSLEELMQIEVTTVSKHRQKLTLAPAAVFALNGEDISRSGAPSLADTLRLVPGMQVSRVSSTDWAISARGFADTFSNKLLVLQDGRSVYTPLFSGVFWDAQDTFTDDIERIEVVRGPGATLWGANAVNGVINILTKPAHDTLGSRAGVTVGTEPIYAVRARHGARVSDDASLRAYGKFTKHDSFPTATGNAGDRWQFGQGGFRFDGGAPAAKFTVQGDAYQGRGRQTYTLPAPLPPFATLAFSRNTFAGANLLARAQHQLEHGGEFSLQGYFDYTDRQVAILGEVRRTFDLEAQHRFTLGNHQLTLGGGYRSTSDSIRNTPTITIQPPRGRLQLWNGFAQDDIALAKNLHLTLGSKFEHNEFTGWEIQPGVRVAWQATEAHTIWASVARAARTPSRAEDNVQFLQVTPTPGVFFAQLGNPDYDSEILTAYEAGWRFHPKEKFSLDLAVFANRYKNLRTSELTPASLFALAQLANPMAPPAFPVTIVGSSQNLMWGETYGAELAAAVQLAPGWRLRAAYSHLRLFMHRALTSNDAASELEEQRSPRHTAYLWSQHDFGRWQLDTVLRHVSRLPAQQIPGYVELDARLAWRPGQSWEFALVGQNLLDRRHPEFLPTGVFTPPVEIPRSVRLEIRFGF